MAAVGIVAHRVERGEEDSGALGYRAVLAPHTYGRREYVSGITEERASAIHPLLANHRIRIILEARPRGCRSAAAWNCPSTRDTPEHVPLAAVRGGARQQQPRHSQQIGAVAGGIAIRPAARERLHLHHHPARVGHYGAYGVPLPDPDAVIRCQ